MARALGGWRPAGGLAWSRSAPRRCERRAKDIGRKRADQGPRVALLSDQAQAPALARARRLDIEPLHLPAGRLRTRIEDERPWLEALRARGVEVVLLAGFMRRLHSTLLSAFPDRVLNIHPSLLPAFPGLDAIRRSWEHGVRVSGCTVHLVEDALDAGPILAQSAVEVRDDDTLASFEERIHAAEHRLYPQAVHRFLHQPWRREGRRVVAGSPLSIPAAGAGAGGSAR